MAAKKDTPAPKKSSKPPPKPPPTFNLTPAQREQLIGIALLALAVVTLLSLLPGTQGQLIKVLQDALRFGVGWGIVLTPIWFGAAGLYLLLDSIDKRPDIGLERPAGALLLYLVALTFLDFLSRYFTGFGGEEGRVMSGGGWIGAGLGNFLKLFSEPGAYVILIALALASLIMLLNVSLGQLLKQAGHAVARLRGQPIPGVKVIGPAARTSPAMQLPLIPPAKTSPPAPLPHLGEGRVEPPVKNGAAAEGVAGSASTRKRATTQTPPPAAEEPPPMSPRIIGDEKREWVLPALDQMLDPNSEQELSQVEIRERVKVIEETLNHFGVPARVIEVSQGPTVTQFGVEPLFVERKGSDGQMKQMKVKVAAIAGLANDLALALAAAPIRIEAPIPGRAMVGIEVPNAQKATVYLRSVLESETYHKMSSRLKIALGQDVSGQPTVADLGVMPHLLIAGATGSGKSVSINSVIACLLMNNTPQDLKLVIVDPKMVELVTYNGIPHLDTPVITDLDRVVSALQAVTVEMDRRYKLFARVGVRNLDGYNVYARERSEPAWPYLVLIIDELADLMMNRPEEIERLICRLAQMSRATGIHLIIATQRPSVDVVTGLIKANFPARIAFAVTTQVDSRVILDTVGAEKLLGRGDMLYMSSDSSKLVRLQGCWVSDDELRRIVRHWKQAAAPDGVVLDEHRGVPPPAASPSRDAMSAWDEANAKPKPGDKQDELLDKAIEVVQTQEHASVSLLQRRLRIGYSRAARLIDLMEEQGIVGPPDEAGRGRKVLVRGKTADGAPREWDEEEE
ncbi:MAG: DNA translocase FtsK [Chloroflexi bacterium]|nr:DNA translocase FtsK [Chloroflexota bacterium]